MTIDANGFYHNTQVYSFLLPSNASEDLKYWLGILNSELMWWFLVTTGNVLRGGYFRFKTEYLNPFPLRTIDFAKPAEKDRHDRMVSLVERMLALQKQLAAAKTDHAKTNIERQIDATDAQIDKLVYDLYGLTEDEIKIVEGSK